MSSAPRLSLASAQETAASIPRHLLRLPVVGTWVEAGESCGRIESCTAVSGLYAPASRRVLEVDTAYAAHCAHTRGERR